MNTDEMRKLAEYTRRYGNDFVGDTIEKAADEIDALRAQLAAQGWQPIESAPRDGTPILLYGTPHNMLNAENIVLTARYSRGWWSYGFSGTISHATHWMPLPQPPEGV